MKWDQFKKQLKKDTNQQRLVVDADDIWNSIESEVDVLNRKKRKRRYIFFWFLFFGVLGVGAGYFLLNTSDGITSKAPIENSIVSEKATIIQLNTNPEVSKTTRGSNSIDIPIDGSNKIKPDKKSNPTNLYSKKVADAVSDLRTSTKYKETNTADLIPFEKTIASVDNSTISPFGSLSIILPNTSYNTIGHTSDTKQGKPFSDITIKKCPNLHFLLTSGNNSFHYLDKIKRGLVIKPSEVGKYNKWKKQDAPFQISVGIYGGVSYANRFLSEKDSFNQELQKIREAYETTLEARHYGLSLAAQHKSGFQISLGIQKTSIAERYKLQDNQTEVDSVLGVQAIRINPYGDTISIMGMIPRTTTTIFNKEIYNSYNLIDLLLSIGYNHDFGKWNVGINAGVLANLSLKTEGIIPDDMLNDLDIKNQQKSYFKSKIGLNYQFGLSIGKSLSDNLEVSFETSLQSYIKDFAVDNYGISQKYTLLGGNLRLKYRIR